MVTMSGLLAHIFDKLSPLMVIVFEFFCTARAFALEGMAILTKEMAPLIASLQEKVSTGIADAGPALASLQDKVSATMSEAGPALSYLQDKLYVVIEKLSTAMAPGLSYLQDKLSIAIAELLDKAAPVRAVLEERLSPTSVAVLKDDKLFLCIAFGLPLVCMVCIFGGCRLRRGAKNNDKKSEKASVEITKSAAPTSSSHKRTSSPGPTRRLHKKTAVGGC